MCKMWGSDSEINRTGASRIPVVWTHTAQILFSYKLQCFRNFEAGWDFDWRVGKEFRGQIIAVPSIAKYSKYYLWQVI
jgi:hypothetical protein